MRRNGDNTWAYERKPLPGGFFENDPIFVARGLLGKVVRRGDLALCITETEAYGGPEDKASHARFGTSSKRGMTPRNAVMYAAGGVWYAYFIYGIHWMLNVVTGKERMPGAVLIRAGYEVKKKGNMLFFSTYRGGPGLVAEFLGVSKQDTGRGVSGRRGLRIEDWGVEVRNSQIMKSTRIGVSYAEEWARKKRRFIWNIKKQARGT